MTCSHNILTLFTFILFQHCYILSHYVTFCHILSHYVTLCHIMSHYVTLCHIMSHYVTFCHNILTLFTFILFQHFFPRPPNIPSARSKPQQSLELLNNKKSQEKNQNLNFYNVYYFCLKKFLIIYFFRVHKPYKLNLFNF
jgi:hypothetical protein